MAANTLTINLEDFRTKGSKVFTGRPRGKKVRVDSKIDQVESQFDHVNIVIPIDIASINPSFLEEFLLNLVARYGEAEFRNRFTFINDGKYKIDVDLEDAIERLLRNDNALAHAS